MLGFSELRLCLQWCPRIMGDQLILLLMGGDQSESGPGVSGVGGMAVAAHCVTESELGVDEGVVGGVGVGGMAAAAHCVDKSAHVFDEDVDVTDVIIGVGGVGIEVGGASGVLGGTVAAFVP